MPTKTMLRMPPPKSWEEFQEISKDAFSIKWDTSDLQIHGRQGQGQHGVDIFGSDDLARRVGIECKNYSQQVSFSLIKDAVLKAEKFSPPLNSFFFATATPRDAKIQKKIRLLSNERLNKNKFSVGILFWEDIFSELCKSDQLFKKHYPDFSSNPISSLNSSQALAALELSYMGMFMKEYVELVFGFFGEMANENPYQIHRLTSTTRICSNTLFPGCTEVKQIEDYCNRLENLCLDIFHGRYKSKDGWQKVDYYLEAIHSLLTSLESTLTGDLLGIFIMGKTLAYCDLVKNPTEECFTKNESIKIKRGLKIAIKASKAQVKVLKMVDKNTNKVPESVRSIVEPIYIAAKKGIQDKLIEK